ncbi:MAG: SPFH domain-containing protein [Roseburia sp.]|nr:SPFH domain-containing protein [Roseburia sp.]
MCFKKKKKEVIEFTGDNSVLLQEVNATSYGKDTTVVVPMTHTALIIQDGGLREKITGGSAPLYRPKGNGFFAKRKKGDVSSIKVIYVSKTARLTIPWGTNINQRISYKEPTSGLDVTVGGFGDMDVRIRNAEKFYLELVAADGDYSLDKLRNRIRDITVNETLRAVKRVLMLCSPAYNEFAYAKDDIQDKVGMQLNEKYVDELGFEVTNFIIENLNIDEASAKELKNRNAEDSSFSRDEVIYRREKEAERRRKRDKVEDLDIDETLYSADLKRKREQEEYLRKNRHEDEDRAWAREDKRSDSEERRGAMYLETVKSAGWEGDAKKDDDAKSVHHCTVCGAAYKPGAKFCPDCGATLPSDRIQTECPTCRNKVPWGTSFCPFCGAAIEHKR